MSGTPRHDRMVAASVWLAQHGALIGWGAAQDGKAVKRRWKADLTSDEAVIRRTLSGGRNSLIVPAGRLCVIDLDKPGWHQRLIDAGLPPTYTVQTPTERTDPETGSTFHGVHVYALLPDDFDPTTLPGAFEGGEIRRSESGEQGMVLGPWALRTEGAYEPVPKTPRTLAVLPQPVIDLLCGSRAQSAPQASSGDWTWSGAMGSRHDHLRDRVRRWVGEGIRGDALRALTRDHMTRHGIPEIGDDGRRLDAEEIEALCSGAEAKFADDAPAFTVLGVRNGELPTTGGGNGIGTRTANDLPVGVPPDLLFGWLLPDKTTLMYGTGGTGKGVIAAIFAALLVRDEGSTVLVIDYEDHPEEWGSRLDALTFPDGTRLTTEEKARIAYLSPYSVEHWTAKTGPLHAVADRIRAEADALGVDYVVVDSYTPATDGDEAMGGQRDAKRFAIALTKIGRPALVLAHVSGTGERLPDKPFGSVHVRNLVARLMYALAQDGEARNDSTGPLSSATVIRVESKRTKGNRYARGANRFIEVAFHPGGGITWDLNVAGKVPSLRDRISSVLRATGQPMTSAEIVRAVAEDYPEAEAVKDNTARTILGRYPDVFVAGNGYPRKWTLNPAAGSALATTGPSRGALFVATATDDQGATVTSVSATETATGPGSTRNSRHNNDLWGDDPLPQQQPATNQPSRWLVACVDYSGHQSAHRQVEPGVWTCDGCTERES